MTWSRYDWNDDESWNVLGLNYCYKFLL